MQQPDGQKLNGQKDAKQPSNGKEMNEKEDFLQQIKTKVSSHFLSIDSQVNLMLYHCEVALVFGEGINVPKNDHVLLPLR